MREIEMRNTNGISFLAVAEFDGKAYFSAWYHNGLFQLHKDGTADFIMLFDRYGGESPEHEFALTVKDAIMFIPSSSEDEIAIFTPKDKRIEYLRYPASEKKCTCRPFWGYVNRNNITYLLPNSYDAVLAFDSENRTFFRYVLPVGSDAFDEEKSALIDGVIVDETVYFCPWNYDNIISFDLRTFEFKILCKVKRNTFRHMLCIDGKIYLIPRILESGLMLYDMKENTLLEKDIPSVIRGICICAFADETGNIYFLPHNIGKVWIWNPVSETLDSINLKIHSGIKEDDLYFNEARDLWGGKIISSDYEILPHLIFDGKEVKLLNINKSQKLFYDILMNMMEKHTGTIICEY